ncbi:MAG: histidine phosphatase family protein [Paracoccus sp. (in: a-proteobacteria)]
MFILRHGETVWNRSGRFQGRQDSPLTDEGCRQALCQRDILNAYGSVPDAVYCSPLGRTRQTAGLIFGDRGDIRLDARLQEIDFGLWEGLTRTEVGQQTDDPGASGLWQFASPEGEDFAAISARVAHFLDDLPGPAIVVTHGTTSQVMRGLCMGLTPAELLTLPKDQGCVYLMSAGRQIVLR